MCVYIYIYIQQTTSRAGSKVIFITIIIIVIVIVMTVMTMMPIINISIIIMYSYAYIYIYIHTYICSKTPGRCLNRFLLAPQDFSPRLLGSYQCHIQVVFTDAFLRLRIVRPRLLGSYQYHTGGRGRSGCNQGPFLNSWRGPMLARG